MATRFRFRLRLVESAEKVEHSWSYSLGPSGFDYDRSRVRQNAGLPQGWRPAFWRTRRQPQSAFPASSAYAAANRKSEGVRGVFQHSPKPGVRKKNEPDAKSLVGRVGPSRGPPRRTASNRRASQSLDPPHKTAPFSPSPGFRAREEESESTHKRDAYATSLWDKRLDCPRALRSGGGEKKIGPSFRRKYKGTDVLIVEG